MGTLNAIVAPTVYLDTNIFIYAVEDFTSLGDKLRLLFSRFDSGELHAVTSELTLAETLVKPIREGNVKVRDTYERMLQATKSLTVAPVDRDILISGEGSGPPPPLSFPLREKYAVQPIKSPRQLIQARRKKRIKLDPDLAREIAISPEFPPEES